MQLEGKRIGFVFTGSFCTFRKTIEELKKIVKAKAKVIPIMSEHSYTMDTKFGNAIDFINEIENITNEKILHTIQDVEPLGPKDMLDILVVAPASGNTMAKLANDIIGKSAKELTANMKDGEIVLLENVRFDSREEANDAEFAKKLASLAEIYVNDAFGTAHRAHASTAGVASYLPAVAGFLMEKELNFLGTTLENPERPFVAILGGKKVSDKIGVIDSLLEKVDTLMIGGGMAYTFFKSMGYNVGNSICELDKLDLAKSLMEKAKAKGVKLMLPVDTKVGKEFKEDTESKTVKYTEIPDGWEGFDIGAETIKMYQDELSKAKTVIWNGPLGLFEFDQFAIGTNAIAEYLGNLENVTTVIGGGDSAAAIEKLGIGDKFTHISTGGGASLEFLEGKKLPGVECLLDK